MNHIINLGIPIIAISHDGISNKVSIVNGRFSTIVDCIYDHMGTELMFECNNDGPSLVSFTLTSTTGTFPITRSINVSTNSSDYRTVIEQIASGEQFVETISSVNIPKILDILEIDQERVEDLENKNIINVTIKNRDAESEMLNVLYENFKYATSSYLKQIEAFKQVVIPIPSTDKPLLYDISLIGGNPNEGITGKDLLKAMDLAKAMLYPYGYKYEEYLLLPMDEDGKTLLPAVKINDCPCSSFIDDTEVDSFEKGNQTIPAETAKRLEEKRKTWDFVYILWRYTLVLIIDWILNKVIKKFLVWPIRSIIKKLIKRLEREKNKNLKEINNEQENKIEDIEEEDYKKYNSKLYLDVAMYNDRDGTDPIVWLIPFKTIGFAIAYQYDIPGTNINDKSLWWNHFRIEDRLYKRRIDVLTDYICNGSYEFGEDISIRTKHHTGRLHEDILKARVEIAEIIVSELDYMSANAREPFEHLLVNPDINFMALMASLKADYDANNVRIYIPLTLLDSAKIINLDGDHFHNIDGSDSKQLDIIKYCIYFGLNSPNLDNPKSFMVLSNEREASTTKTGFTTFVTPTDNTGNPLYRNCLYIPWSFCYVYPDTASLQLKNIPKLENWETSDNKTFKPSVVGYKRYVSPECQKASLSLLDKLNNDKHAKKEYLTVLSKEINLELQITQAMKKMGKDDEYDQKLREEAEKTEIGQTKMKFRDKFQEKASKNNRFKLELKED